MFRRVEKVMKTVETVCGEFPAPALNEIRMAFYHVILAVEDDSAAGDVESALKHCKRAYYDAREIEVLAELEIIMDFERACSGHEDIVKANIRDYADKRKAVLKARDALNDAALTHSTRDELFDKYDQPCQTLRAYCAEISAMQPAISTAIRKQKIKFLFQCLGALAALSTIIGLVLRLFF